MRKLLDLEWCLRLADQLAGHQRLSPFVPADVRAVQCTLFAKTIGNNWLVSFHQDLSIPVSERVESARCSGWSQKQGDTFCQTPVGEPSRRDEAAHPSSKAADASLRRVLHFVYGPPVLPEGSRWPARKRIGWMRIIDAHKIP